MVGVGKSDLESTGGGTTSDSPTSVKSSGIISENSIGHRSSQNNTQTNMNSSAPKTKKRRKNGDELRDVSSGKTVSKMAKRVNNPQSIHSLNTELVPYLKEQSIQTIHASSLQRYFAKHPEKTLDDFFAAHHENLPDKLRGAVEGRFVPFTTTIDTRKDSSDGSTTKLAVKLQDGQMVETVIMRYNKGEDNRGRPRISVCISSQIGCKMGCTFCATGTMGLKGHLTSGEIVEQLIHAITIAGRIDNVVFMGMGEPLDNYDAVLDAIKVMTDGAGIRLAPSKICVSTVGLIPRMRQIIKDAPDVRLALSLHAPTQDIRVKIVPTAKAYPLERIMEVVDDIIASNRQVLIEYVLIRDLNDTVEAAEQLGVLLGGSRAPGVHLNLIPYNPTDAEPSYQRPTDEAIEAFDNILSKDYGVKTTIRRTMGDDIDGACGQLVLKKGEKASKPTDLEDMFTEGLKKRKGPAPSPKSSSKLTEVKDDPAKTKKASGKELEEKKQIEEEAEEGLNELRPQGSDWAKNLFPFLTLFFFGVMALALGYLYVQLKEPEEQGYRSPFLDRVGALPTPQKQ
ncbi:hypothetical protein HDU67_004836 [Dinochytrium kinnereticum]|nr:hypothetical protein HDU67_004836 [Dinochytrium kinnereticum]